MPYKKVSFLAILTMTACLAGCDSMKKKVEPTSAPVVHYPPHIAGTVGQYARMIGGGDLPVRGYGIVIGLGTNGSSEVPPNLMKYFTEYLVKQDIGSWRRGTEKLTPERLLRDLDTSVVNVGGGIPPGAPKGSRFDLYVSAMPQTQTRSLEGGILMPTDLYISVGGATMPGGATRPQAIGGGSAFVNPFADPGKTEDLSKLRTARVIGGGEVKESRKILLQLLEADYARADLIQRRINERFGDYGKVAIARDPTNIEIIIPPSQRSDYDHFLRLILHLPVQVGPGWQDVMVRRVVEAMEQPDANQDELSLVMEAMGRQIVPLIRPLYTSKTAAAAFYAARAGIRLGDEVGATVVGDFARTAGSPFQIPAIEELGRHPDVFSAASCLPDLLDDDNDGVRLAAYEALHKRGPSARISSVSVAGDFRLDVVRSIKPAVVYATQSEQARIVLFGNGLKVSTPIYFTMPDDMVTISAQDAGGKLSVFRKVPRSQKMSDAFTVEPLTQNLIVTLGSRPEIGEGGTLKGLGLTYGQVVGVLYRLCKENDIQAKFVLQPLPEVQKIYRETPTVGRPDAPD